MADSSHRTCRYWIRRAILFVLAVLALGMVGCLLLSWLFESYYHPPVSQKSAEGDLVVEIWVSDQCPTVGETVMARATVTNEGSGSVVAELKGQPVFDLFVGEAYWSEGKPLTPDLTHLELKPGESKIIEMRYVVKRSSFGVSARFIPNAQYIEYPISPYMIVGNCSGFIGP